MTLHQLIADYLHYRGALGYRLVRDSQILSAFGHRFELLPLRATTLIEYFVFWSRMISVTTPSLADTERSAASIAMSKLDTALSCQPFQTCPTVAHRTSRHTCTRTPNSSGCSEPLRRLVATLAAK